jgi:hypothetical protein
LLRHDHGEPPASLASMIAGSMSAAHGMQAEDPECVECLRMLKDGGDPCFKYRVDRGVTEYRPKIVLPSSCCSFYQPGRVGEIVRRPVNSRGIVVSPAIAPYARPSISCHIKSSVVSGHASIAQASVGPVHFSHNMERRRTDPGTVPSDRRHGIFVIPCADPCRPCSPVVFKKGKLVCWWMMLSCSVRSMDYGKAIGHSSCLARVCLL